MTRVDVVDVPDMRTLLARVAAGDEIVIEVEGQPVAKLSPISTVQPRKFGFAKDLIQISPDFDEPLDDFAGYR